MSDPRAGTVGRATLVGIAAALALAAVAASCAPAPTPPPPMEGAPLFADLEAFTGLPQRPRASASSEFWEWWGDGRAELSGYRMTVGRYGAPRPAELALIYVTEPHDRRTWIKDDDAGEPHRVEVLKLNQNLEFLTGIYPYSVMTSVFAPVDRYREQAFQPVRIVHQVQEWCGAYSHLVWPGPRRFRSLRLSYFAHEGERMSEVEAQPGTLYEDALLVQLRELDGPFADGGDWEGTLVPELWRFRVGHRGVDPVPARITRAEAERETAAGTVPVTRFVLEADTRGAGEAAAGASGASGETAAGASGEAAAGGPGEAGAEAAARAAGTYRRVFDVEREWPRRILGWTTSTGDEAELLATERLAYWELNRPGDESWREALGLDPRGSLPPATGNEPAGACPP